MSRRPSKPGPWATLSIITLLLGMTALLGGCGPDIERVDPDAATGDTDAGPSDAPPTVVESPPEEPADQPPEPTIPEVKLPETLARTCKVGVGDPMPSERLPNIEGQTLSVADLMGERLTVLVFWSADNAYSTVELQDLSEGFFAPAKEKGVAVVAVNVGDPAEKAQAAVASINPPFPVLLDSAGSYFAQVATEKLPRTYLLDADGKILWFDLEYSAATRRQLDQAVEAALLNDKNDQG
jgi:peroxiredoxin